MVIVPFGVLPAQKVTHKSCQKTLGTKDQRREGDEKRGMVGQQVTIVAVVQIYNFLNDEPAQGHETYEKNEAADKAEHVHGFFCRSW